jgi:hypothetical protein
MPTFLKSTCWLCGTDPSTLERESAWAHQISDPKQTEAELGIHRPLESTTQWTTEGLHE